jgi:hypothetical protein
MKVNPMRHFVAIAILVVAAVSLWGSITLAQQDESWRQIGPDLMAKAAQQNRDESIKSHLVKLATNAEANRRRYSDFGASFSLVMTQKFPDRPVLVRVGTANVVSLHFAKYYKSTMELMVSSKEEKSESFNRQMRQQWITVMSPESWWELDSMLHGQLKDYPPVKGVLSPPWRSRVAYRREPAKAKKELEMGNIIYPNVLFQLDQGGAPEDFLKMIVAALDDSNTNTTKGALCFINGEGAGESQVTQILYAFGDHQNANSDLAVFLKLDNKSGCPIEFVKVDKGKLNFTKQWQYKEENGGVFPTVLKTGMYDSLGVLSSSREMKLSKFESRTSQDKFDASSLDLTFGERLVDEFEKRLYVFNGSRLVPVEQFDYSQVSKRTESELSPQGYSTAWLAGGICLGVVAIIALIFIRGRIRR